VYIFSVVEQNFAFSDLEKPHGVRNGKSYSLVHHVGSVVPYKT